MNIPIKPKEPTKLVFDYERYNYVNLKFEDDRSEEYPFLYLSDILDSLPKEYKNQEKYIKFDFSESHIIYILTPKNFNQNKIDEYEKQLKQYQLDLNKYELEMAKYELHLAEEKVKNLEKLYAKT